MKKNNSPTEEISFEKHKLLLFISKFQTTISPIGLLRHDIINKMAPKKDESIEEFWLSPNKNESISIVDLLLKLLVDSGELTYIRETYRYSITGKGIEYISNFEIQEKRHKDNCKLQKILIFLIILQVIVAIVDFFIKCK